MGRKYTKELLEEQLAEAGVVSTDCLMVHSSMKAIGDVEARPGEPGGAETVIDALLESLSDGMLLMPTHTWKQMSAEYNVFDPATEPACVGILPNLFRKREGVYRSLHPTHSMAACGRKVICGNRVVITADEYVKGEENTQTPCAPGGCWDRLRVVEAKILLVGVTHARNTFIHSIEEALDVPERFTAQQTLFYVKMPDKTLKPVPMYRHYSVHTAHISEMFDKLMNYYFETGAAKKCKFGDADCILCDARALFGATKEKLDQDLDFFMH